MPGNAVLSVGILWGPSLASRICGDFVGAKCGWRGQGKEVLGARTRLRGTQALHAASTAPAVDSLCHISISLAIRVGDLGRQDRRLGIVARLHRWMLFDLSTRVTAGIASDHARTVMPRESVGSGSATTKTRA